MDETDVADTDGGRVPEVDRLEIKRQMGQDDIEAITELLDAAGKADHHRPLGEHKWLDLVQGGREGFAGLVAWQHGHPHPVGYAQLSQGHGPQGHRHWAMEYVVDPHHRHALRSIASDLLHVALGLVASEGGGRVHLWVNQPRPEHDDVAAEAGLMRGRDLYQMRRLLPVRASERHGEGRHADQHSGQRPEASALALRAFVPGRDEATWLALNNRAFQQHPEQGGWTIETLRTREREPWFDPEGFLLHEHDGRLIGFCWTKVHNDHEPPLGEIYVVAVDPECRGQGLGRALMMAGLDSLAARGLEVAMLYVDAANAPAVRLYEDLGFTIDHIDRTYITDVAARKRPRGLT